MRLRRLRELRRERRSRNHRLRRFIQRFALDAHRMRLVAGPRRQPEHDVAGTVRLDRHLPGRLFAPVRPPCAGRRRPPCAGHPPARHLHHAVRDRLRREPPGLGAEAEYDRERALSVVALRQPLEMRRALHSRNWWVGDAPGGDPENAGRVSQNEFVVVGRAGVCRVKPARVAPSVLVGAQVTGPDSCSNSTYRKVYLVGNVDLQVVGRRRVERHILRHGVGGDCCVGAMYSFAAVFERGHHRQRGDLGASFDQ